MEDDALLDLLDTVYACGAGHRPWSDFIEQYRSRFPSLKLSIAGYDSQFKDLNFFMTAGIPEDFASNFASHYYKINPWEKIVQALPPPPDVAWVHDYLPTEELMQTPFYNEFLKPLEDIATGFGCVLFREEDRFLNFQANVSFKHIDEGLRAAECMRMVGPHLVRAFELYRQLGGVSSYAASMEDALNHLNKAVIVLDDQFRMHFSNEAAQDLLREGTVVREKAPDHLIFCSAQDESAMRESMWAATGASRGSPYFRLRAGSEKRFVGFVTPLRCTDDKRIERAGRTIWPTRTFALFLTSIDRGLKDANIGAIREVLGVSGAEAALAKALTEGVALPDYAQQAGISYHTARSHLKSLLAKTGISSQASLIQVLTKIFAL